MQLQPYKIGFIFDIAPPSPYTLQGKHALEEDPCSCSHLGNICEANKELLKARNAGEGVGV